MTQVDFGRELGRVHQSVQGYESGKTPPPDVIEKYKTLAIAHGRGDLAVELAGEDWKNYRPRRVIHPGETSIGTAREKGPKDKSGLAPADPLRVHWHTILDEILDSGQADAINAIEYVLLVTEERVHLKGRKSGGK